MAMGQEPQCHLRTIANFILFRFFAIKVTRGEMYKIIIGSFYTYIGLVLFLSLICLGLDTTAGYNPAPQRGKRYKQQKTAFAIQSTVRNTVVGDRTL